MVASGSPDGRVCADSGTVERCFPFGRAGAGTPAASASASASTTHDGGTSAAPIARPGASAAPEA
jgi:hypothetical protein